MLRLLRVDSLAPAVTFCAILAAAPLSAHAQAVPLRVDVDASRAPQRVYHVSVTMPATPGPFTFVYPEWIPGYHTAAGPIEALVNMHVASAGSSLEWRRDLVDMYAIHTVVPPGAATLDVTYDIVGAESQTGTIEPLSTPNLALVEFSNLVVYPQGAKAEALPVDATLTLPDAWQFGTALPVRTRAGNRIVFATAPLYTVVDSPVIAGLHYRAFPLGGEQELDAASDGETKLKIEPAFLTGLQHLVEEGPALYGNKHYRDYHFLLTLSEHAGYDGIEHHESSDNRAPADYMADRSAYRFGADLLPHEYSHSWNGKYRRPADLYQPDYQIPERDDLLWVYEGLNQYNGEVLATRARIQTFDEQLEVLAKTAATMDAEFGRRWRPIRDTADAAPFLFSAPGAFDNTRRDANDFYSEGDLIWLDADVTIRKLTNGVKSLDDFDKLWAAGGSTTPSVLTYRAEDVYALLNQVAPYDWAGFFRTRIAEVQTRAPIDGIFNGGYRLAYAPAPSEFQKGREGERKTIDALFSIGMTVATEDGTIRDVVGDGIAYKAGIAPGSKIVALDGRAFSPDVFHEALQAHANSSAPLQLLVSYEDSFTVYALDASMGERYPHLERIAGAPDVLARIYWPRTFTPKGESTPAP